MKIVITGMGAVTPIGLGVNEYWNNLIKGKCGISNITLFDTEEMPVKIAGEVKKFPLEDYMPKDLIRKTDSFMQFAYIAACEALDMSKIEIEPLNTGIVMGTALGGITPIAETQDLLTSVSPRKVGPRFVPKILGNVAAANIAIEKNIQGPSYTVSTACSSGGDAIGLAAMCLKAGKAETMLVVGGESAICPIFIHSLSKAKALSHNDDNPEKASRPFDKDRDGFVIGEGGGALVLETEEHAKKRGAKIIAELLGCGNTEDAYHVTAPHPEGRGAINCMELALKDAGITADKIGYVNAHGTSTGKGDTVEAGAIKSIFKDKLPLVSSTKGATGHMMGAGGITEVITCIKAIEEGIVPPTINLDNVDEECEGIDFVPNVARKTEINAAMSNAFGFGGQNSSIIVGRYDNNK